MIRRVDWEGYQALLLKVVGDRRSVRMTYDRGTVELMSPGFSHEKFGYLLGRMVQSITEELDIPMASCRSTTLKRADLERGLEADDSYYLSNFHLLPREGQLELEVTPPPDLAIEIEITNSILDRLGVYAALGVPEIWRFDGEALTVLLLGPDGTYSESETSRAFPFLPLDEIVRFMLEHVPGEDTTWSRGFRAWCREVLLPLYQNHPRPEE